VILDISQPRNRAIMALLLLRFTDSDYPFGIFKLFLHNKSSIHTRNQKRIANVQTSYPDKSQDQSNNKNADIQFSEGPGFISIPDIIHKIHITMHKKT
jgi:hypothetical protein